MLPTLMLLWACTPTPLSDSPNPEDSQLDSPSDSPVDTGTAPDPFDTGDPLATQLLLNPSFEEGESAWSRYGEGSYDWSESGAQEGAVCLSLGGSPYALLYQRVPATPGQLYRAGAWARSESGRGNATLKLEFHDAQGLQALHLVDRPIGEIADLGEHALVDHGVGRGPGVQDPGNSSALRDGMQGLKLGVTGALRGDADEPDVDFVQGLLQEGVVGPVAPDLGPQALEGLLALGGIEAEPRALFGLQPGSVPLDHLTTPHQSEANFGAPFGCLGDHVKGCLLYTSDAADE